MTESKQSMLERGKILQAAFCTLNDVPIPAVREMEKKDWVVGVCAYYRQDCTSIQLNACASIGTAGRQWSFPGHYADRTPYGVIAHELGHHCDLLTSERKGRYYGDYSVSVRKACDEKPITSYCPNDAEWFAEMFRLFVTNPDLLRLLRPRTHAKLLEKWKPVFTDTWRERLQGAPERTIAVIERKISA